MKTSTFSLLFIFIVQFTFAQVGSSCGFPDWDSAKGYPANSYIEYEGSVYLNSLWSQNEAPGLSENSNWVLLGVCNEQVIIDTPELAYTNCKNVNDWDSTLDNYNTADLVNYKYGVYKAKYWVAGTELPEISSAYEFLGVCILPIEITPEFSNQQIIVQSTLQAVDIQATINTNGFTAQENKIRIKKTSEQTFSEFSMSLTDNTTTYSWTPSEYGEYDLQYYSKNSVGVETTVNRIVNVVISTPSLITLISPNSNAPFTQINFAAIEIRFSATPTDYPIVSITLKDVLANASTNIPVTVSTDYSEMWTPQNYGDNDLELIAIDTKGTINTFKFKYKIQDLSGGSCGVPQWNNISGYPPNSYVLHNDVVYVTTSWSQDEKPDPSPTTSPNWVNVGVCNEQLIIDNPALAFTECEGVNSWDSERENYFGNDLVNYNNGIFMAKYWVDGEQQPGISDAYEFLGICIIPIEITPDFLDRHVVIQSALQSLNIQATLNKNGFTSVENKIRIKNTTR